MSAFSYNTEALFIYVVIFKWNKIEAKSNGNS